MDREELKKYLEEHGYPRANQNSNFFKPIIKNILDETKFLDDYYGSNIIKLRNRLFCLAHDIFTIPLCKFCKVEEVKLGVSATHKNYYKGGFNDCCSKECSRKYAAIVTKKTNLERYGHVCAIQSKSLKEKIKKNNLEKFGVEHVLQSKEIRVKINKTNLEKYGNICSLQGRYVKEKTKITNLNRYGYVHPMRANVVKDRVTATNIEKYGCEYPLQNDKIKDKVSQTNLEKYGNICSLQGEAIKAKVRDTNMERYGVFNSKQKYFDIEILEKLQDYESLIKDFDKNDNSIKKMAIYYGVSVSTILRALNRHNIDYNFHSKNSFIELVVQDYLKEKKIEFITNDRTIIKPQEIDILIPRHKLAIELNGIYFHSEKFRDKNYHQEKSLKLIEERFKPFHIYEDQILDENKSKIIFKKLDHLLGLSSNKVFARKCTIDNNLSRDRIKQFYDSNHIQGHIDSKINIGLSFNNELVALISFKQIGNDGCYDLTRFATSTSVVGGFSKLLTYFKNNYDWKEIITYANLDYSSGDLYHKTGFEQLYITRPNYFYVKNKKRFSRQQFMKHKLKDRLEVFDPYLSEGENMRLNGYLRVYDSGSIKFKLENKFNK